MAIDKSRSKPWVKTLAIILALALLFGLGALTFLPLLVQNSNPAPTVGAATTGQQASATSTTTIDATYKPRIEAGAKKLEADPNNYDLLLAQAATYQEWASKLADASGKGPGGADMAYWPLAIELYKKALVIKPGGSEPAVNLGLCYLYSGNTALAVTTIEAVTRSDPKFSQPHYFLGRAYAQAGQKEKAIAAFQQYVKLEPAGEFVKDANAYITELKAAK